jgi:hypothetical protein
MMNKEFKLKMVKYFESDYEMNKRKDGMLEVFNSGGGVEDVFSKEEIFETLNRVNSFEELDRFWNLMGGDYVMDLGSLIDEISKEKIA